ncbi:MAG: polysaccharide biosynthesis protein [Calditrichales bacterium]|nr:polysaccharide biosynthesis protein [Calditrichales bacterium]
MNNYEGQDFQHIGDPSNLFSKIKLVKIFLDAVLLTLSYMLAYNIRFDFNLPPEDILLLKKTFPLAVLCNIAAINLLRMNQSRWRYSSIQDLINLFAANTAGWVVFVILLYFTNLLSLSRSILAMYWMLSLLFLGAARMLPRIVLKSRSRFIVNKRRVVVIGAGSAGEMIIRQMKNDPKLAYYPVALVDDSPKKLNSKIHGVKVLGGVDRLNEIIQKNRVEEIIIATPAAHPKQMLRIVQACEATGIEFKTIPGAREIVNGHVELNQIRKVKVEDLLDRSPVEIDLDKIQSYLEEKTILITGSGGSIGSELARQILKLNPVKLICLDRTENSLFFLENELRQLNTQTDYEVCIADILDSEKISKLLMKHKPDIVFHAAAYKHVPLMELHPEEAVRNNVIGTMNMMKLSEKYGVEKFVLISTDKAVNPTSIMGATKRIAELMLQSYSAQSKTQLLTVRFGNVLNSFGSVIPLFQKQIARGGPVTITHADMKRFFMTIPEAVVLILQAAKMSRGNEIYVLDMGEQISLMNIARRLIKLSGFEPEKDIAIEITGTRPGEKIEEELWNKGEVPVTTDHYKILMAMGSHFNHWDKMSKNIEDLDNFSKTGNIRAIYERFQEIIPEYVPDLSVHNLEEDVKSDVLINEE